MTESHSRLRRMAKANFDRQSDGYHYKVGVFAPGAKCPNHACRLYLTDQPGVGICEISGYHFNYEEGPTDESGQIKDKNREFTIQIINGKYQKTFKVAPGFKREVTRETRSK